jgi:hypothetical protein
MCKQARRNMNKITYASKNCVLSINNPLISDILNNESLLGFRILLLSGFRNRVCPNLKIKQFIYIYIHVYIYITCLLIPCFNSDIAYIRKGLQ